MDDGERTGGKEGREGRKKERKRRRRDRIHSPLSGDSRAIAFPFSFKPSSAFLPTHPVPGVQSTPFIMTMPVSLTKDDPSCGYKLPQDPHIGFLPSPLQNLTVPSYLALNVGKWRWIASFAGA